MLRVCLVLARYYKTWDIQHVRRPLKYLATTQAIFFNNHFNTVQGKSQPHTAQNAVTTEPPGSSLSNPRLVFCDTHLLSKFFSKDSCPWSGKEHGLLSCETNGRCVSGETLIATPGSVLSSVCDKTRDWFA